MTNVLSDEKKNQILALGGLRWSLRRIEEQTCAGRPQGPICGRGAARSGTPSAASASRPATTEGVSTDSGAPENDLIRGRNCRAGRRMGVPENHSAS